MISAEIIKKHKDFAICLCFSFLVFLFIISFSIALPIYLRPIYYIYANSANLAEKNGLEYREVKEAYDAVLDYLTLPEKEFSTGVLKYSEDGKSHFEDCKKLFSLNTSILIISAAAITVILLFSRKKKIICRLLYRSILYSGTATAIFPLLIGAVCAVSFDYAFTVFHKLFFPGKSNWIFNPQTDEIIRLLPQEFFALCAVIIGTSILVLSLCAVYAGLKKKEQ